MVTIAKIDSHNITPASYTPQNRQQILQDTQVQEKKELEQKEKEINEKIDKEQIKQEKDTNLYSPAKEKDSYQKPVKSSEVSTKDISNFKTSSRQAKIEDRTDNRDKNTAAEKLKEKVANRSRIKTLKNVSKRITGTSKKETGNRTKKSKTQTGHSKQKKHTEKEQKTYKGNSHIIDNKNKYDYKDLMPLEEKKIPQHTSKGKSDKTGQITGESTKTLSNPLNIAMAEKIKLREAMEKIKGKQEEEKQQGEQRILKKNPGENSKSNKLLPLNEIRKNYEKKYKEIKKTGGEAETGGNGKNIQEIKRRDNSSRTTEAISQTKAKENNIHDEKSVKNLPEERKNLIKDKDIVREKSGSPNELTEKKDIRDGRDNADKDIKRLKELENKEGMTEKQKIEIRGKRKEAEDIKNEREELSKEIAAKESRKKSENEIKKPLEFEENSNSGMKPKERIDKNKIPKLISLEKLRENYNMKYNGFKTQELKEARHAEYVIKDNKDISSKNSERENQRIYKPSITNEPAVDQLRQGEKIKERDTEKDKKIAVKLQDKTQPVRERKMDFDGKSDVSHDRDKIFPGEAQMTGWKYTPSEKRMDSYGKSDASHDRDKTLPGETQKTQERHPVSERKIDPNEKRETLQEKFRNILSELRGTEDKKPVTERNIDSDEKGDTEKSKNIPSESGATEDKKPVTERNIGSDAKDDTEKIKNILSESGGTEDKTLVTEGKIDSDAKHETLQERFKNILSELQGTGNKQTVSGKRIAFMEKGGTNQDKDKKYLHEAQRPEDKKSVSTKRIASDKTSDVSREKDKKFLHEARGIDGKQPASERRIAPDKTSDVGREKDEKLLSETHGADDKQPVSERRIASDKTSDVGREKDEKLLSETQEADDKQPVSERRTDTDKTSDVGSEKDSNTISETQKAQENQSASEAISQEKLTEEQKENIQDYNNSLKETINTREEIETAKGDLEKIEKIKNLESKENNPEEANKLRADLGLKEGDNLDQKAEELKKTIKDKEEQYNKDLEKTDELYQKAVENLPENAKNAIDASDEALSQKRTELQEELQPKKDEVASNKEEITGLEGDINNLKISKDSAVGADKTRIGEEIKEKEAELEKLKNEQKALEQEIADKEKEYIGLRQENEQIKEQLGLGTIQLPEGLTNEEKQKYNMAQDMYSADLYGDGSTKDKIDRIEATKEIAKKIKTEDLEKLGNEGKNIQSSDTTTAVNQVVTDVVTNMSDVNKAYNDNFNKASTQLNDIKDAEAKLDLLKSGKIDEYNKLTGENITKDNVNNKIEDLETRKGKSQEEYDKLVKETTDLRNKMINLLPEEQKKDFLAMEATLKDTGNQLAESYMQKEIENSDYTAYMEQAKADRQELKDQLSSMEPDSKEYSQCKEQLDALEQNIDIRQEEHNAFEQNLSDQEQEYIKERQERDLTAKELGIGLSNDPPSNMSSIDKTKYEAINGMLVGKIPPGDNPVEDALINDNIKKELSLKSKYSVAELKDAKDIGTTITVGNMDDLGGTEPGAMGYTQGTRIFLSDKPMAGVLDHEMGHITQNYNIMEQGERITDLYNEKCASDPAFKDKYINEREFFADSLKTYKDAKTHGDEAINKFKEENPDLYDYFKEMDSKNKLSDTLNSIFGTERQDRTKVEPVTGEQLREQWDSKPDENIAKSLGTEKDYYTAFVPSGQASAAPGKWGNKPGNSSGQVTQAIPSSIQDNSLPQNQLTDSVNKSNQSGNSQSQYSAPAHNQYSGKKPETDTSQTRQHNNQGAGNDHSISGSGGGSSIYRAPEKETEEAKEEKNKENQESDGLSKEEKAVGMTKEEKAAGMTKEEKAAGMTKEEKEAGMTREEKEAGMNKEDKTAGMTREEKEAGMVKEEKTAGITKEEHIKLTKEDSQSEKSNLESRNKESTGRQEQKDFKTEQPVNKGNQNSTKHQNQTQQKQGQTEQQWQPGHKIESPQTKPDQVKTENHQEQAKTGQEIKPEQQKTQQEQVKTGQEIKPEQQKTQQEQVKTGQEIKPEQQKTQQEQVKTGQEIKPEQQKTQQEQVKTGQEIKPEQQKTQQEQVKTGQEIKPEQQKTQQEQVKTGQEIKPEQQKTQQEQQVKTEQEIKPEQQKTQQEQVKTGQEIKPEQQKTQQEQQVKTGQEIKPEQQKTQQEQQVKTGQEIKPEQQKTQQEQQVKTGQEIKPEQQKTQQEQVKTGQEIKPEQQKVQQEQQVKTGQEIKPEQQKVQQEQVKTGQEIKPEQQKVQQEQVKTGQEIKPEQQKVQQEQVKTGQEIKPEQQKVQQEQQVKTGQEIKPEQQKVQQEQVKTGQEIKPEQQKVQQEQVKTGQEIKPEQQKVQQEQVKTGQEIKPEQQKVQQEQVKTGQEIKPEQQIKTGHERKTEGQMKAEEKKIETGQQVKNEQKKMVSEERTKAEEKRIETEQKVKSEQKKMEKEPVKRYEEIKSEQTRVEQKQVKPGQNIKTEQQVRTEEVIKKPVQQVKDTSAAEAKISDLTDSEKKTEERQKENVIGSNDKKIERMIKTEEETVKTSQKETAIKNNDGNKKEVIEHGEIKSVFDKLKKEIISDKPDSLSHSKAERPSGQLDALSKVAIKTLKENSEWKGIKTSDLLQSIVTTDIFSSSKDTGILKKFEGIKDRSLDGSITPVSHRDKIVPSKELIDKKGPNDISREDKPFVQNNLFQFLKEKAFTIISAIQLLIGNSDKAANPLIRESGDRLNLQDNVSLYDKSAFTAKEDIKERKRKIMPDDVEMEQFAALEKAKNVTVIPTDIHADSKLQLLRQCQMCQTKVGVDMVLCPACAKLRKNLYTELKLLYKTDGNKNYFTGPVENKNYLPGHISGGKQDHLELSLDAINVFSRGELEEVAAMRKGQVFPKMREILALSKENSMYKNKEAVV